MKLIDIHNHCAWAMDDGIQTKEECCLLLDKAFNDGIIKIISTPHFIPGKHDQKYKIQVLKRMDELKKLANDYKIEIYSGSEVFLNSSYMDMISNNTFISLANSKYILVEFNVLDEIGDETQVEDRLYEIILLGYFPIIAHVERYFHKKIDTKRVERWIEMGCFIQVNRSSLLGMHGTKIKRNAVKLIKKRLVHLIASDAHTSDIGRNCILSDAFYLVEKVSNSDYAELLFFENPQHIINDEKIETIFQK